jgi:hypothetical protein
MFACSMLHVVIFFGLLINPENGGDMFLRNVFDFQRTTQRYIPEDGILHLKHLYCTLHKYCVRKLTNTYPSAIFVRMGC